MSEKEKEVPALSSPQPSHYTELASATKYHTNKTDLHTWPPHCKGIPNYPLQRQHVAHAQNTMP